MIKAPTSAQRFDCLSPISAEFSHHAMKILSVIIKRLWNKGSRPDLGTMRNEQICIEHKDVNPDIKKAYNKDFLLAYTDGYIIAAICHYFGMEDINSSPTRHALPADVDSQFKWAQEHFRDMVRNSVGTF